MAGLLRIFLTCVGVAILAAVATARAEDPPAELAIDFPDVKGWQKVAKKPLPKALVGYSVGYKHPKASAETTIWVFTRGKTKLDNQIAVEPEFSQVRDELHQAKTAGTYDEVQMKQ